MRDEDAAEQGAGTPCPPTTTQLYSGDLHHGYTELYWFKAPTRLQRPVPGHVQEIVDMAAKAGLSVQLVRKSEEEIEEDARLFPGNLIPYLAVTRDNLKALRLRFDPTLVPR